MNIKKVNRFNKLTNINNSYRQPKLFPKQYRRREQRYLKKLFKINSIDEVNFDEIITFNHTYLKFRLFDGFKPKIEEFPFLMNHEFILAGKKIQN